MTTSQEMLELAAKAIGMVGYEYSQSNAYYGDNFETRWAMHKSGAKPWNPDVCSIDAMNLAAALGMRVDFGYCDAGDIKNAAAVWLKSDTDRFPRFWQATYPDTMRNARMTILRAAAHVGKLMENQP